MTTKEDLLKKKREKEKEKDNAIFCSQQILSHLNSIVDLHWEGDNSRYNPPGFGGSVDVNLVSGKTFGTTEDPNISVWVKSYSLFGVFLEICKDGGEGTECVPIKNAFVPYSQIISIEEPT